MTWEELAEAVGLPPDRSIAFQFTDCEGGANPPRTFGAESPLTPATVFLLTDGSHRVYDVKRVEVADTGEVIHDTPGFYRNRVDAVTCRTINPENNAPVRTLGILTR